MSHPFQANKDSEMDLARMGREEERVLETMAFGQSSKPTHAKKKKLELDVQMALHIVYLSFTYLLILLLKALFCLRRQHQNVNAADVLREQPLSCNGSVSIVFMSMLLKV